MTDDGMHEEARRLLIAGKPRDVVALLESRPTEQVLTADEAHYYGRALLELGQPGEAMTQLNNARRGASEPFWVLFYVGRAYQELADRAGAFRAYSDALGQVRGVSLHKQSLLTELSSFSDVVSSLGDATMSGDIVRLIAAIDAEPEWLDVEPLRLKIHNEIPVTMLIVDALRPGDVAYDVGANVGDLSALMSRLVGPKGSVVSFEANSRTAILTANTLKKYHAWNVLLLNKAVASTSKQASRIYLGSGPDDSLISSDWLSDESLPVRTVALDDIADYTGLRPSFIKVDVEGFEPEVLKGAVKLLGAERPIFILEQRDSDQWCIDHMVGLGYELRCCGSYRRISRREDYFRAGQGAVRNLIAVHPESEVGNTAPIRALMQAEISQVALFSDQDLRSEHDRLIGPSIELSPGRYSLQQDYHLSEERDIEIGVIDEVGRFVGSYFGSSPWLEGLPDLPFHLDSGGTLRVCIRDRGGRRLDDVLTVTELVINKVEGFPAARPAYDLIL